MRFRRTSRGGLEAHVPPPGARQGHDCPEARLPAPRLRQWYTCRNRCFHRPLETASAPAVVKVTPAYLVAASALPSRASWLPRRQISASSSGTCPAPPRDCWRPRTSTRVPSSPCSSARLTPSCLRLVAPRAWRRCGTFARAPRWHGASPRRCRRSFASTGVAPRARERQRTTEEGRCSREGGHWFS